MGKRHQLAWSRSKGNDEETSIRLHRNWLVSLAKLLTCSMNVKTVETSLINKLSVHTLWMYPVIVFCDELQCAVPAGEN